MEDSKIKLPKDLKKQIRQALSVKAIWLKGGKHIPKKVALLLEQIEPHHTPAFYRSTKMDS